MVLGLESHKFLYWMNFRITAMGLIYGTFCYTKTGHVYQTVVLPSEGEIIY